MNCKANTNIWIVRAVMIKRNQPAKSYQEFAKINPIECITCHRDVHDGKFGKDCKSCHNQESFRVE
ncbi:MAG: hypothetical protein IPJ43_06330 [Saprospiraceae bacterium]|nr:hypothetical protein [Saprospiraceae bacterium]